MVRLDIHETLLQLGIILPEPPPPAAHYIAVKRCNGLIYVSGQAPRVDRTYVFTGKLGENITIESGIEAARLCAINILAQLNANLEGNLNRLISCVKVTGYINSVPTFTDHSLVLNGASDLFFAVFGKAGLHSRTAVGCSSLPANIPIEVEAIFEFL